MLHDLGQDTNPECLNRVSEHKAEGGGRITPPQVWDWNEDAQGQLPRHVLLQISFSSVFSKVTRGSVCELNWARTPESLLPGNTELKSKSKYRDFTK